jgi:general secretion pathway protein A
MYESFFELSDRPFASAPEPRRYYPAPSHEEALALLQCCVNEDEGIGLLVGPPGAGKTLLAQQLVATLQCTHTGVHVNQTHSPLVRDLLQAMFYDMSAPFEGLSEQELRLRLCDMIVDRHRKGTRTLVVVDEAHHLTVDQLEELRLLLNLEGRAPGAVSVVLVGQKRLLEPLRRHDLEALRQRVAVVTTLRPLDNEHTIEYIRAQIARCGGSADSIFTASALSEIFAAARGIPRSINQICHRALMLAFVDNSGTVDTPYVEAALASIWLPGRRRDYANGRSSSDTSMEATRSGPGSRGVGARPAVIEVGADLRVEADLTRSPKKVANPAGTAALAAGDEAGAGTPSGTRPPTDLATRLRLRQRDSAIL